MLSGARLTPAEVRACVMSGKKAIFSVRPFEKLQKTMEQKSATAAPPALRQKKKEDYTDEELFSKAMDDVQEIEAFRVLNCDRRHARTAPAQKRDPERETLTALTELAAGHGPMHLPDTQEYVSWTSPDYHDAILANLHSGQFSVQSCLDLHGCTVAEAEEELDLFLRESFRNNLRCVKIIHGRGLRSVRGPRIKDAVARRLSGHYRKDILAYVTARQCDGGLGAVYVLLRKK